MNTTFKPGYITAGCVIPQERTGSRGCVKGGGVGWGYEQGQVLYAVGARHTVGTDICTYVCTYIQGCSQTMYVENDHKKTLTGFSSTLCHSPNSGEMGRLLDSASFSLQYICGWGERERERG